MKGRTKLSFRTVIFSFLFTFMSVGFRPSQKENRRTRTTADGERSIGHRKRNEILSRETGKRYEIKRQNLEELSTLLSTKSCYLQTALQRDKENLTKDNLAQKASVTTLNAKIETLNNNLERQKKNEKELQVCMMMFFLFILLLLCWFNSPWTCCCCCCCNFIRAYFVLQETNKKMRFEKEKEIKEAKEKVETKSKQKIEENNKMIQMLQKRVRNSRANCLSFPSHL